VTPIPDPVSEAENWERVVTGSAPRLLDEYFAQLRHRRRVENAQLALETFSPVLGALVVLASLFAAIWLIDQGHSVAGGLLGSIDLVGFFVALILLLQLNRATR
jgi:hypothetical protein